MSTYKTNHPKVIEAFNEYYRQCVALGEGAKQFAKRFGTDEYLVFGSVHEYRFGGLKFSPPMDRRFWSVPEKKNGTQYPRKNVTGMTQEEKEVHKTLRSGWDEHYPRMKAETEPVYQAIGTSWSNLLFGAGMKLFLHDGYLYVKTGAKLADYMVEILGSEFDAACVAIEDMTKEKDGAETEVGTE